MPSQYGSFIKPHAHTPNAGDGGALPYASTLVASASTSDLLSQILAYRRPCLQWVSGTTVQSENNTGTASETGIFFGDWDYRTDSTAAHRVLDVSRVAVLNGTNQSGLRTGTVAVNTWYAVYAVKCTNSTTDFVLVADTVFPSQANYATLNSNFGTNGWVYLGMICNGDNSGATNTILKFNMTGNFTSFRNALSGNAATLNGPRLAAATGTNTGVTWTYAAGGAVASAQIPAHITSGVLAIALGGTNGDNLIVTDSAASVSFFGLTTAAGAGSPTNNRFPSALFDGLKLTHNSNTNGCDIALAGFFDGELTPAVTPLL